jgi:hypothetical protein
VGEHTPTDGVGGSETGLLFFGDALSWMDGHDIFIADVGRIRTLRCKL